MSNGGPQLRRRLLGATAWVAIGIIAGRLLGFAREALIGRYFGTSAAADAIAVVLTAPDLFQNILIGGALSASLLPLFQERQQRSELLRISIWTAVTYGVVAAVLVLSSEWVVGWVAPALTSEAAAISARALPFALLAIPFGALAGVTTARLQASHRFAVPSLGTFFYNMLLVTVILVAGSGPGAIMCIAVGVCAASFFRWLIQILSLLAGDSAPPAQVTESPGKRPLLRRYLEALAAGGLLFLLPFVARAHATFVGEGGIAAFNYAWKLVELPLGAVLTILPVVIFPTLAEMFRGEDSTRRHARRLAGRALEGILLVSIIVAMMAFMVRIEIAQLVFAGGRMSDASAAMIGTIAGIGFSSLPAQAALAMLFVVFQADRDTSRPFMAGLAALLFFYAALLLTSPSLPMLAGMLSASYWLGAVVLLVVAIRRYELSIGVARVTAVAGGSMLVLFGTGWILKSLPQLARIAGMGAAGAAMIVVTFFAIGDYRTMFRRGAS